MSFSKSQGKKQEGSAQNGGNGGHQQKQQNRSNNSNKKWANNNNSAAGTARNNHASTTTATGIEQDATTTKQLHDRMLFLLGNLTGTLVEATVKDGCKFKGIFHGASTEGDLGIALKLAQKIYDPNAPIDKDKTNPNPIKNTLLIFSNDLVEINAVNVDFSSSCGTETNDRNTFKTDTDISGRLDIKERELHKWAPTEDDHNGPLEGGLELNDNDAHGGGSWDQFAANEKLFGLKTDFDEEIYTTPLNRSAPGYKDREKRAIKMANEIQKTATTNVHMLEERGLAIDDSGMDEEDLYGAVVREGVSNPNKYVPPALRKLQQQQQQQQTQKKEKPVAAGNPLNKLITSDLPKAASNPSPIANLPTTRRESSEKNNSGSNEPPKRIEAEIATTFRHFAMMEKDKLHAKKQALQKKEKDGRLAELKAFHQSFKLNVPIPADLVPLLSKKKAPISNEQVSSDSANNRNIASPVKKISTPPLQQATTATPAATATTAKKVSSPAPPAVASPTTSPAPSSPAPATTTATTTTTTTTAPSSATSNSFKFNVKASSFKPNPSAAAFVPGGGATAASRSPAPVHMGMPMPHHTSTTTTDDNSHPHTFFGGGNGRQSKKGNGPVEHLTMTEAFVPSFIDKNIPASSVGPTWPFGHKSYRVQFSQFGYDEDVYSYPSPNYGYYPTQYRYPFPHHQMPYPQFVQPPPMPPGAYSPQMANVSPHGSPFPPPPPSVAVPAPPPPQQVPPQGYPSPQQRSPMVPQQMPPPQLYQYGGGAPMMMRYPPDMMMQRPVMVETVPYSPHHPQQQQQQQQQQDTPGN
ncbi:PHO85 cyclin-1 [Mucor velutinosus]|uniref:PHO85 cyclin-1 n=1 Tax=Mucor velutinosus TaxID=708070 RepID=A0AAN7DT13_9FUNG|nr:PHO85 cyclin-1 [Mucor velutinosus]